MFGLSKPNPIMILQSLWSRDEVVILHNKFGKKVLIDNEIVPDVIKKMEHVQIPQKTQEEVDIWCQPAHYENKEDPLYGDTHAILKYGNKFIFKGVIVESEDLYIVISCTDENVTEGSVIFPKNKDRRWWRINKKAKTSDGIYMIQGLVSDYQPSFV